MPSVAEVRAQSCLGKVGWRAEGGAEGEAGAEHKGQGRERGQRQRSKGRGS